MHLPPPTVPARPRRRTMPCAAAAVARPVRAAARGRPSSAAYPPIDGIVKAALPQGRRLHPAVHIEVIGRQHVDHHTALTTAPIVFRPYVGFNVVLCPAALQTIPRDLYEAATMDGAGRFQQFRHITLPGLRPMIFFGVTLGVNGGRQRFEAPFILTGGRGGPDPAGMTSAVHRYRMAFDVSDFGGASALPWVRFVCVAALAWVTNRLPRPEGPDA